ncbi:MAG: phosphatase PAP2 family protein [Nitrospirae bacterium]|nr:phosphatase PAP2 family protein [Nitrospirota bacterium]NTW66928.1 phosphatase PAP2 family protein [Nitrospirota bacterium]
MIATGGPVSSYRRFWIPELVTLVVLSCATLILFAVSDLDIAAARWFYHPQLPDPWPVASEPLWNLFYRSAPWITGSLAVAGTTALIGGLLKKEARAFRTYGLFILLCVAIGPGLIVNGILKDNWGRARPRQIVEFGGRHEYTQPLVPASAHGKSFPCGHCSVGYLYAFGWWLLRRRHPKIASLSLVTGLTLGTMLGFGRMAAGGHFLSDNIWSGLIALGVAHTLYYYILRIPAREDSVSTLYPLLERDRRFRIAAFAGAAVLGVGILIGGVVASPHYLDLHYRTRLSNYPIKPELIEITAGRLDVELVLISDERERVESSGAIRGFGLPTNDLQVH